MWPDGPTADAEHTQGQQPPPSPAVIPATPLGKTITQTHDDQPLGRVPDAFYGELATSGDPPDIPLGPELLESELGSATPQTQTGLSSRLRTGGTGEGLSQTVRPIKTTTSTEHGRAQMHQARSGQRKKPGPMIDLAEKHRTGSCQSACCSTGLRCLRPSSSTSYSHSGSDQGIGSIQVQIVKLEFHDCADADSGNEAQEGSVQKDLPELDDDEFIIFEPSFDDIDLNVLAARSPQSDFEDSLSEPPELEEDEVFDIDPDYEMTFDSDSEDGDVFVDTNLTELAAECKNVIFHDAEFDNEDIDLMMNEVEVEGENLVWGSGFGNSSITMNSNTDPWDTSDPWSPYRTRTIPISQVYPETSMETPIS